MNCIGRLNSCDLAMNRTFRRIADPRKKWSMNEKWFGARMTGPLGGTWSASMVRVRKTIHESSDVTIRTSS
jgi:hypothetical protein